MSGEGLDPRWRPDDALVRRIGSEYGTPTYVISEAHFVAQIRAYSAAFEQARPGSKLTFASKANSVSAILAIAHREGCLIDVASEGELRAALKAGIPARDCHLHGSNKSDAEIEFALSVGIGQIVADNFEDLARLRGSCVEVVLRLAPGVLPITNRKISTGQSDTKFGFSIDQGAAERAVSECLSLGLNLGGFHCHVGSQLLDPEAQIAAGRILAKFAIEMRGRHGFSARELNVGGGRAARYTSELPIALTSYCQNLVAGIDDILAGSGLEPRLVQEPGRSLIAESGVTVYRIGSVKEVPSRRYVSIDGGLADNPRPALYDAVYELQVVPADGRTFGELAPARVSGRHCETDEVIGECFLPADLHSGDLAIMLTTGAYSSSMASNYNRYPRPATVLYRQNEELVVIQEGESFDAVLAREVVPDDLMRGLSR
jgi:diaminopimelate decarboxylase